MHDPLTFNSLLGTHLPRVTNPGQGTDGIKSAGPAHQQMGLVVLLQDLDVVCTLRLLEEMKTFKLTGGLGRVWRRVGHEA